MTFERKRQRKYLLSTMLRMFIGLPVVLQVILLCAIFIAEMADKALPPEYAVPVTLIVVGAAGLAILYKIGSHISKRDDLPENAFARYLPIAVAFFYYMGVFAVCFAVNGLRLKGLLAPVFLLTLPFFFLNVMFTSISVYQLFPILYGIAYGSFALMFFIACKRNKRKSVNAKGAFGLLAIAVILCVIVGGEFYARSRIFLLTERRLPKTDHEVDLWEYRLFDADSRLQNLPTPSLVITNNYPRLDGATAMYPIYGSMAQTIYKGLNNQDWRTIEKFVNCTKTDKAYERLINGEIDIFFGLRPSQQHIDEAAAKGIAFQLFPIAKEAFVFFVNRQNPVDNLTVPHIKDIYQKRITNWRDVGGNNEKIMPFQRPQNSGSQTIMQNVMGDKTLPPPLREEFAYGMGGIINQVASYRNYTGAIGYSFRFYATEMNPNADIKLLAVDGVAPSADNIRNSAYPLTEHVYAVTTREPTGNVKALIDWILSPEGQSAVEQCGYVGIAE